LYSAQLVGLTSRVATANAGPKLLRLTNLGESSIPHYPPQPPRNCFFYTLFGFAKCVAKNGFLMDCEDLTPH